MTRPPLLVPFYFPGSHKIETVAVEYTQVPTALEWVISAVKKIFHR